MARKAGIGLGNWLEDLKKVQRDVSLAVLRLRELKARNEHHLFPEIVNWPEEPPECEKQIYYEYVRGDGRVSVEKIAEWAMKKWPKDGWNYNNVRRTIDRVAKWMALEWLKKIEKANIYQS